MFTREALEKDKDPDLELEELALAVCEQALHPASYELPSNYLSRERFDHVLLTLNRQASPGYPYSLEASTIGEWLKFDGLAYDWFQTDRLWYDVECVIRGETEMWLKAFIKMEPHSATKIALGRWRVIMCFPLNYQVLWKMLFDYGNEQFLTASYEIPIQHGMKLVGGDWKLYRRQWIHLGLNAGTDISAFDWCVTLRKMRLVYELRRRLAKGPHVAGWFTLASRLLDELFLNPRILFPDGEVYILSVPAVQKSGSPNTIADNSILRLFESVVISMKAGMRVYPLPRCVGDDSLEKIQLTDEAADILRSVYRQRGWRLKQIVPGLEFVGHDFKPSGPVPLYEEKHLWRYCHMPGDLIPEFLEGMARLYAHSPLFSLWESLALRNGVRLMSQSYYKTWYDSEPLAFDRLV